MSDAERHAERQLLWELLGRVAVDKCSCHIVAGRGNVIQRFVEVFEASRDALREEFSGRHPANYKDLVTAVVKRLAEKGKSWDSAWPDPERIVEIDHGEYQGTLLYVIGAKGYQPSSYWSAAVGYGSCSGCDTLEAIRDYCDEPPTKEQTDGYMQLMLNVVQGLRQIHGYGELEGGA